MSYDIRGLIQPVTTDVELETLLQQTALARQMEREEIIAKGDALVERYNNAGHTSVLREFLDGLRNRK